LAELQTNPAGTHTEPHDAPDVPETKAAATPSDALAPRAEPTDAELERAVMQPGPSEARHATALTFIDRVEAFIARLSTKNHFWHRVCSLIWLPYAFKSGIRMKKVDETTFTAVLPFKRFNRNWYNAMAGASLLANSEIAGGMYIFGITGGKYTLVCKKLEYEFLRPCFGPAVYRIAPREDLHALIATGREFNITLDLVVMQQALVPETVAKLKKKDSLLARMAAKERRVGVCTATFHLTPALHQKAKRGHVRKVG
jgi:hypothetical protein